MKSFALLRTNTGLTTNVKIVVDSSYGLSLDSIESNQDLAATRLKKVSFNKKNYFDELVPYFFKDFPTETAFAIKYENDSDSMTENFASQYDELYQYGARNIVSNKDYTEEFEYFAPLHISKGKLPKAFAIFRVDGPGMIKLDSHNIKDEIFDSFKAIKVFDLTKKTVLGEWLDLNFINNQYFPDAPFEMSFDRLEFSQWNGIDYDSGGYTTKSLFMDDFVEEEKEIFEFERFVFDGFRNSKIVYPNIINFSFLFDDTPADSNGLKKWSINRYYGFYIENMDLVKTMSPYRVPFIKKDAVVQAGNVLYSPTGDPFIEGWSTDRPFYVEYQGEYYKVEKFVEKQKASLKPIVNKTPPPSSRQALQIKARSKEAPIAIPVDRLSGNVDDAAFEAGARKALGSGVVISQQITPTYVDRWRIVAPMDLSGKQALLNANIGYVDSATKVLMNYDNTELSIDNFDMADIWMIEIDGMYHNLIKEDGKIKIFSDYSFKFYENFYEYWINKPDPAYTKRGEFADANNMPNKFKIYRLSLTDIKDFDDRIVDTEFSKFEYEMEKDLTDTEETKLYLNNLNSQTHPKDLDDFVYKNKVAYIPASSEYTVNHETFKVVGDELSPIWRKNPVYCRWAFEDSLSANDYPYVLNNSIRFEDYNRTVNPFDPDPDRKERNLDYFYTINSSTFSYLHHTLHIEDPDPSGLKKLYFDFEKYLGQDTYQIGKKTYKYDFDYFSWFFDRKTTFLSNKIHKNVKKHSLFSSGDKSTPNITLFRGIKFLLHDVDSISRNSNGQIESVNLKDSNSFEDYKFSILLTHTNNGMFWDVVDEWKMEKAYKKGEIVAYADILYRAKRDHVTTMPVILKNSIQIKAVPYNLEADWEYYISDYIPLYSPLKGENRYYLKGSSFMKSVVYNSGDYYLFNGYEKPIDFWNPMVAYKANSRLLADTDGRIGYMGYSEGSIVLYRGDYYKSLMNNNIYPPNFVQETYEGDAWKRHWVKIAPVDPAIARWTEINIWNPSLSYDPSTYIVHEEVLYKSDSGSKVPSGEEPGKSAFWIRIYSFLPDTDFRYQPQSNPMIRMNNEYYMIVANPWNLTLENGIRIYINKRWKNVLVNIAINDNTITGLSGTNRDQLYSALNKKLTAMNFIECVNNLSNKHGFTDYLKYIVIAEDGTFKEYDFNNISSLPHIIFAEKPQQIEVKANSLKVKPKRVTALKPSKVLEDGKITDIRELNYFNKTHIATTIEASKDSPVLGKTYHGGVNETADVMFRFSGNYFPLFYDIELFKRSNSIEYNEMQIALNLESTQDLVFTFGKDGQTVRKLRKVYSGGSYSNTRSAKFTVQRMDPERPPLGSTSSSPYNRIGPVTEIRNAPPASGLTLGDRYIIGLSPTGDWSGTFKVAGTTSLYQKKNAVAEWQVGYYNPNTGGIVTSTSSVPNWNPSVPIVGTWSYYAPKIGDIANCSSISSDIYFAGASWPIAASFSTPEEKFAKRYSTEGTFVNTNFYNQIRDIILSEDLFSGIEFIFEVHPIGSQYAMPALQSDYGKYDRAQAEEGNIRNQYILSVKYKSHYGNLSVEIDRQHPYVTMDIIDAGTPGSNLLVTLGATGINPPFQWSVGYTASSSYDPLTFKPGTYSSATTLAPIPDASGTNWIFDVTVKDSAGLTSSTGHYMVNAGNTYSFSGTFSYVSL